VVGILTAFNFPMAVWAWNSMLALVCGDACVWKPSERTPLVRDRDHQRLRRGGWRPRGSARSSRCASATSEQVAKPMVADARLPLISFTGSIRVGKQVAARRGRALRAVDPRVRRQQRHRAAARRRPRHGVRARSSSARWARPASAARPRAALLVHEDVADEVEQRLVQAYGRLASATRSHEGTLCGPLISARPSSTCSDAGRGAARGRPRAVRRRGLQLPGA
jgi:aldehyde dehydrogenase (NAD+)